MRGGIRRKKKYAALIKNNIVTAVMKSRRNQCLPREHELRYREAEREGEKKLKTSIETVDVIKIFRIRGAVKEM